MNEPAIPDPRQATQGGIRRFRVGVVIVIAFAVGLIIWLAVRDNGNSSTSSASADAAVVSVEQIQALATSVGHPVFWVGPTEGSTYELVRTSDGSIFLRYLPQGVKIGTREPHLTVATYPFPHAYEALKAVAKGSDEVKLPNGGIVGATKGNRTSVHFAFPGVDYQGEIYDPSPGKALALATAGRLAAVGSLKTGSTATSQPTAVSLAQLKSLAKSLGHPIYWAGPKKGNTYELALTPNGQVLIRYLPRGTKVGASGQYLTVGTYPHPSAFVGIQALAKETKAAAIKLPRGGLAVVEPRYRRSIHLAYPGSDYQVEVFDPSPAAARRVVSSGRVKSIG